MVCRNLPVAGAGSRCAFLRASRASKADRGSSRRRTLGSLIRARPNGHPLLLPPGQLGPASWGVYRKWPESPPPFSTFSGRFSGRGTAGNFSTGTRCFPGRSCRGKRSDILEEPIWQWSRAAAAGASFGDLLVSKIDIP